MRSSPRGATRSKLVSRACTSMLIGFLSRGGCHGKHARGLAIGGRLRAAERVVAERRVSGGFPPRSAAEQREHGQYAPVVVLGLGQPEPLEDPLHVALDSPRAEVELLGDR